MKVFYPKGYETYKGPKFENPSRLSFLNFIKGKEVSYDTSTLKAIERLHGKDYINKIKDLKNSESNNLDLSFEKSTFLVGANAVAATIEAARNFGFAAVRPPGHHASSQPRGFCYFNNILIAVNHVFPNKKVAILDLDAHYGDGTHEFALKMKNIRYFSIHANPEKYYPYRKFKRDNDVLIDVEPEKVNDKKFIEYVNELISQIKRFQPDVLALSIGFDTFFSDPVIGFLLKKPSTYKEVGEILREEFNKSFAVLEGGYSEHLPLLILNFLEGFFGLENIQFKESPKKVVKRFRKKKGATYSLSNSGEIIETITNIKTVSTYNRKEGMSYVLKGDSVVEFQKIMITDKQFIEWKKVGLLNKLYNMGYEFDVVYEPQQIEWEKLLKQNVNDIKVKGDVIIIKFDKHSLFLKKHSLVDGYVVRLYERD